jgi:SAM-dependent methyltransferase
LELDPVPGAERVSAAIQSAPIQDTIEWTATRTQTKLLLDRVRSTWVSLGITDPYWSVFTTPSYRSQTDLETPVKQEFYHTGWRELDHLQHVLKRNRLEADRIKKVIDWGCGVGRVTIPLCKTFGSCLGVDISDRHIGLARSAANKAGVSTIRFMLVDEFLRKRERADLIYSLITLQHNPPPLIVFFLSKIFHSLRAGGIAIFQVPCALWGYRFKVSDYLAQAPLAAEIEMHAVPQEAVFKTARQSDCDIIEANLTGRIGSIGLSYLFVVRKRSWLLTKC